MIHCVRVSGTAIPRGGAVFGGEVSEPPKMYSTK